MGRNTRNTRTAAKLGPNLDFSTTESYNLLRTNILYSISSLPPIYSGGRVIGITSPSPQEGKSYTSINLSYSLAEAGNRVLLIDADMRRPSIAKTIGKSTSPGLSNYLIGETSGILHTGVLSANLDIIMAGAIPPNPSELIGSKKMSTSLELFSKNYDYILIDLPPVNAVSDPIVISKYLDGILIVTRHEHTRRSDVQDSIRQLSFAKAHILGFVYNGYSKTSSGYKYRKNKYSKTNGRYGYSSAYIVEQNDSNRHSQTKLDSVKDK